MTGAAGALGSDLVRRFADEGANVDVSPAGDTDVDAPELEACARHRAQR